MEPARFEFELLQPSMLRMIRSARSRLHRDSGSENCGSSGAGVKSGAASTSAASSAATRWCSTDLRAVSKKPTSSVEQSSERSAKRPGTPRGTIKGRTQRLTRSRSSIDQQADLENAAPEKSQAPLVPIAVLGDATNTYSAAANLGFTFGQQKPPTAPDAACPPKPTSIEPLVLQSRAACPPTPTLPAPASEGEVDETAAHSDDPQYAEEYVQDIFNVLKREEPILLPSPTYMERQAHVNAKMRSILVDWLVDVHKKYKLRPETLFLAVHLIDRYLEIRVTQQRQLQLVGVTALLIAAKYEEVYPPQIKDFVYVTDKAYTREDILLMEVNILNALQYKICRPTTMHFLERYQSVNGCTDAHRDLGRYLLELTLVDYNMLKYAPSHLAAASILLSNKLLRRPSWTPAAVRHTKMTEPMLKECAKSMCILLEHAETNPLQAIRKKYSHPKYHSVAKLSFVVSPSSGQDTATVAASARERRGSITSSGSGRRSVSGAMEVV